MENELRCFCQHCGIELPPNHTGPCPKCGKSGKLNIKNVGDGNVGPKSSLSGNHKPMWSSNSLTMFFGIVAVILTVVSLGIVNFLPFKPLINYLILIFFLIIASALFWRLRYSILTLIRKLESKFGGEKKF
jgi:hypothetical protein